MDYCVLWPSDMLSLVGWGHGIQNQLHAAGMALPPQPAVQTPDVIGQLQFSAWNRIIRWSICNELLR